VLQPLLAALVVCIDMSEPFERYLDNYNDFSSLLAYGETLVSEQVGKEPKSKFDVYGERIFVKLPCHGITLREISPSPGTRSGNELWDISSSYAIARALIESFDALSYISLGSADEQEREFRLLFWKLHAEARRLDMLSKIGSTNPEYEEVRLEMERLRNQVLGHKCITNCKSNIVFNIQKGKYQPYHLTQKERNIASGINHEFHNAVTMHLSSHVHTHPFSVQQIVEFKAGSPECIGLMGIALQYSSAFLSVAIIGMRNLFLPQVPELSEKTKCILEQWAFIAKKGVKHY